MVTRRHTQARLGAGDTVTVGARSVVVLRGPVSPLPGEMDAG
jgi:hypothetical protein